MTKYIAMKCAICGYEWKFSERGYKLYPYKICENCALIGPNEPAQFKVSKKPVPSFLKDREAIIVSESEMQRLYDEYYNQLANVSKYLKERYGKSTAS